MDALEDGQLILPQAQGLGEDVRAHLPGELILGDVDGLPPVQHGEVAVEKVDVQAEGGLVVDGPLPVAGGGLRVDGVEVVVHGDGVGLHAGLVQELLDLHGGGGLAGAGGAGEQDDVGLVPVARDALGGQLQLALELRLGALHEGLGVILCQLIDVLQRVSHRNSPFVIRSMPGRSRRRPVDWPATSPAC